jgi:hypothetical protein
MCWRPRLRSGNGSPSFIIFPSVLSLPIPVGDRLFRGRTLNPTHLSVSAGLGVGMERDGRAPICREAEQGQGTLRERATHAVSSFAFSNPKAAAAAACVLIYICVHVAWIWLPTLLFWFVIVPGEGGSQPAPNVLSACAPFLFLRNSDGGLGSPCIRLRGLMHLFLQARSPLPFPALALICNGSRPGKGPRSPFLTSPFLGRGPRGHILRGHGQVAQHPNALGVEQLRSECE